MRSKKFSLIPPERNWADIQASVRLCCFEREWLIVTDLSLISDNEKRAISLHLAHESDEREVVLLEKINIKKQLDRMDEARF